MTSKNEFEAWRTDPMTKQFFAALENYRLDLMEAWAAGNFTHASVEGTIQLNAKALGQADILDRMKEIDHEWLIQYSRNV